MTSLGAPGFALAPAQRRILRFGGDGPGPFLSVAVLDVGAADLLRLERALATVVARHEALRSELCPCEGLLEPLQCVSIEPLLRFSRLDAGRQFPDPYAVTARLLELEHEPRGLGAYIAETTAGLLLGLVAPAIFTDDRSYAVLACDLARAYNGTIDEREPPLQYPDIAGWLLELQASDDAAFAEGLRPPCGRQSPLRPRAGFQPIRFVRVVAGGVDALDRVAHHAGVDRRGAALAAWALVAAGLSEATAHVDVACLLDGRRFAELDGTVGPLRSAVVIRIEPAPGLSCSVYAAQVGEKLAEMAAWQEYMVPPPDEPASEVSFVWDDLTARPSEAFTRRDAWSTIEPSLVCMRCAVEETALVLDLTVDGGANLAVAEVLVDRMAQAVLSFPEAATTSDVDVLAPSDRVAVLRPATPNAPLRHVVHEIVARHARTAPDSVAVIDRGRALTYGDLDDLAGRLAARLVQAGVRAEDVVAIGAEPSSEAVVALLAVMKAGAAYLPLDPLSPSARLRAVLCTASVSLAVTTPAARDRLSDEVATVTLDINDLRADPILPLSRLTDPDQLAYVVSTSGSTGDPKAVAVTHANLVAYVSGVESLLGLPPEAALATGGPLFTDLAHTALFGSLLTGRTFVVIPFDAVVDPHLFGAAISAGRVDCLKITPSHLQALLVGEGPHVLPREILVLGGERCPPSLIDLVRAARPACRVVNHYGPAETTVGATAALIPVAASSADRSIASVPIGTPLSHVSTYVLNRELRPTPAGAVGTLYVGGAAVARGYLGAPAATAERFVPDPFSPVAGARMYATGDLVQAAPDGVLTFVGREDHQVKIRGFRVEFGDVESALRSLKGVLDAVVDVHEAGDRLVAWVHGSSDIDDAALREQARALLPEYAVPVRIEILESLPLTSAGKVDRTGLVASHGRRRVAVPPQGPIELLIGRVWSEVLDVDAVDVEDHFFDAGGHSLLATQVVSRIRDLLGIELSIREFFDHPTVRQLGGFLEVRDGERVGRTAEIVLEVLDMRDDEVDQLLKDAGA